MIVKRFREEDKNKVNLRKDDCDLVLEIRKKIREQEKPQMEETRSWLFWASKSKKFSEIKRHHRGAIGFDTEGC